MRCRPTPSVHGTSEAFDTKRGIIFCPIVSLSGETMPVVTDSQVVHGGREVEVLATVQALRFNSDSVLLLGDRLRNNTSERPLYKKPNGTWPAAPGNTCRTTPRPNPR